MQGQRYDLYSSWTLWDQYYFNKKGKADKKEYAKNNKAIASFDNLRDFQLLWDNLPFKTPSKLFTNPDTGEKQWLGQQQISQPS